MLKVPPSRILLQSDDLKEYEKRKSSWRAPAASAPLRKEDSNSSGLSDVKESSESRKQAWKSEVRSRIGIDQSTAS